MCRSFSSEGKIQFCFGCFQPLTELTDKKCKRCGIYEHDSIKSDDVFDEWEFCASDFTSSDGKYIHVKEKEFNATFLCPECVPLENSKYPAVIAAFSSLILCTFLDYDCCYVSQNFQWR